MREESGSEVFKKQGVSDMILDTVYQKIRREANHAGYRDGHTIGFEQGTMAAMHDFMQASTVTNVVYNGMKTIVKFADGGYEIVTYNPNYGYAYDPEKAIMAGILKHIVGNRYIHILKNYGAGTKNASKIMTDMNQNVILHSDDDYESYVPEAIYVSPDGTAVNLSDDEKLLQEFEAMDFEIDLG